MNQAFSFGDVVMFHTPANAEELQACYLVVDQDPRRVGALHVMAIDKTFDTWRWRPIHTFHAEDMQVVGHMLPHGVR